jgi:hypothetical protein
MEALRYVLLVVLMLGIVGGYWWWTTGRHGSNAQKFHLGLAPQEEARATVGGRFHLDVAVDDLTAALVGMQRVPRHIWLTVTRANQIVLKIHEGETIRFTPQQAQLSRFGEGLDSLTGLSGQSEVADGYALHIAGRAPLRMVLPRSAAELLASLGVARA